MAEREGLLRFTPFYSLIRYAHRRSNARLSLGRRTLFSRVQIPFSTGLKQKTTRKGCFFILMTEREGLLRFTPFYSLIRYAHRRSNARLSLGRRTLFSRVQIPFSTGLKQKTTRKGCFFILMAEREGFEPSVRFGRTHDFQSCAFDHSAISPDFFFHNAKKYFCKLYFKYSKILLVNFKKIR